MNQDRYVELFRVEAREHLAELDATLMAFEHDGNAQHIADLFRNTHTIKGMAAAMGYDAVERIAHAIEALLDDVRGGRTMAHTELTSLLFQSTEVLHQCVERAIDGAAPSESAGTSGSERDGHVVALNAMVAQLESYQAPSAPTVSDILNALTHAPVRDPDFSLAMAVTQGIAAVGHQPHVEPTELRAISVRLTADCPLKGVRALLVLARLESLVTVSDIQPLQSTWSDDSFDGLFTVQGRSDASNARLEAAVRAAGDIADVKVGTPAPRTRTAASSTLRTVRVDRQRLDTLLDLVGELVVTRDRLTALAEESDQSSSRALTRTVYQTARLISALQEEILQTRMVPVGQVFDRFPRLVRDIAKELGKDVEFVTEGHEIELDRALVDALSDPLIHLLRNALDHGVESADERRRQRKPAQSRLVVRAARDRAAVVIQVEDDGKGVDRHGILARAHESGLVDRAVTTVDDDALLQILAHPGFSTAGAVTKLSGRGVGVDVVATRVRALGGVLELETITGVGSVFTLRLPVSLAIARALLVQVGGETYALPAAHVVEALEYDPSMVATFEGRESFALRDELLPIVHMRERFGYPQRPDEAFVAVVEASGRRSALIVDALVAQQDIVVKPFDAVRGSAPWFTGATVLGDGTPALIVDLGSLT